VKRVHEDLPDHFSSELSDYQIIGQKVGLRPGRVSGIRVEKEEKNGQKIVHAYGMSSLYALRNPAIITDNLSTGASRGGYIFSFGMARAARDLVEDFLFPSLQAKL